MDDDVEARTTSETACVDWLAPSVFQKLREGLQPPAPSGDWRAYYPPHIEGSEGQ